jgi:serine protease Do
MNVWKKTAFVAALLMAAGVGAALTPVARGQGRDRTAARLLQAWGGGGRIGVTVKDLDDEDMQKAKLASPSGVLVEEVGTDSPAEKAGLKTGDVIVDFDGEKVRSTRQFTRLVQETPAGRKVQATVLRDGQRTTVTLEPRESDVFRAFDGLSRLDDQTHVWTMPPTLRATPAPAPRAFEFEDFFGRGSTRLGVTLTELSPQLATYFGAKEGVLVSSVSENSAAAKAGLKAGDVITAFNGATISAASDLRRRLSRAEDDEEFTIGIVRDHKPMTLKGKFEPRPAARTTTRTIL